MKFIKTRLDSKIEENDGLVGKLSPMETWNNQNPSFQCACCNNLRKMEWFAYVPNDSFGVTDKEGRRHTVYCQSCAEAMATDLCEKFGGDKAKAIYAMCAYTGVYYDDVLAKKILRERHIWDDGTEITNMHWFTLYTRAESVDERDSLKSFSTSDNLAFEAVLKFQYGSGVVDRLSDKDKANRATVIAAYHRDPFEDEPFEDRPSLYEDLITMGTDDVAEDLPKARAAIEIVRGYSRIDKINAALLKMQQSIESMVENEKSIKALSEQKKNELNAIGNLSKDHGFAEKYANARSKGSGTITAIVRDMKESGYDWGAVNKFDIETARAMQQVADISAHSMFKQLNFTSADYSDMVKEQAEEIRKMQNIMMKQAEELRILKEEHLKQELLAEYRQKLLNRNINEVEIDQLVEAEVKYNPFGDLYVGYEPTPLKEEEENDKPVSE